MGWCNSSYFYCESSNAHAQTLQAQPHSAGSSAVLTLPTATGTLIGTGDTGTLPVAAIDIDGATDIGADIVDADLFIIDDGAGGTNRKVAASRIQQTQLKSKTLANPLNELATKLKLKMYPKKIIGCDISHLQSTNIVASAVCFINGSPAKHLYRKFSIKTVNEKSNDPKSMKEVVLRRLQLCIKENEELPDLFLIDGGIAQLNFAYQALQELNLESKKEGTSRSY